MNLSLILALAWLLGAVVLFAYEQFTGDMRFRIRGTDLSAAWLLLVLGLYNLARWWSLRRARADQQALRSEQVHRRPAPFREPRNEPPDPNFNFTDEPRPPG
jgi:hypothetical protein